MRKDNTLRLLKFGGGGVSAEGVNFSVQGLRYPESFRNCTYDLPHGGLPVLDIRDAIETPEGYAWVFRGPMCDPSLPDGVIDTFDEEHDWFTKALASAIPEFGGILEHHTYTVGQPARALDRVSINQYLQGWRDHGARVGILQIIDNEPHITWETT